MRLRDFSSSQSRGDFFFLFNNSYITLTIQRGAHQTISDQNMPITLYATMK